MKSATALINKSPNSFFKKEQHPFHLLGVSPWPVFIAFSLLEVVLIVVSTLHDDYQDPCFLCQYLRCVYIVLFLISVVCWFNNIIIESTFEGNHTRTVHHGVRIGMLLFIASEVMIFVAFFWGFFHVSLYPSIEIGGTWPPQYMFPLCLEPQILPLINTLLLISSGISVTWAHRALIANPIIFKANTDSRFVIRASIIFGLAITIIIGITFTTIQGYEYYNAAFNINDSIYGAVFYSLTGLHGLHVMLGTGFIMIALKRVVEYHFTRQHHFNLEAAIWYWHFVDVVWLFLFITIYCWPFI